MRRKARGFLAVSGGFAFALSGVLAGCNNAPATSTPSPAHEEPAHAAQKTSAPGAKLGTEQAAGPFRVTLALNPPEAQVGDATFTARITRDGQPVKNARVKIGLSMPAMQMPGPDEELKHAGGGAYSGQANLGMAGDWRVEIEVESGQDKGKAVYDFNVVK